MDELAVVETAIEPEPWWLAGWSKHLSPSSFGRAAACPRSEAMPHAHFNSEYAARGTVGHKFLADCIEVGRDLALGKTEDPADIEWLAAIEVERLPAFDAQVYSAEVSFAYDPTTRTARELGRGLSRDQARALAQDHEIVATADLVGVTEDTAVVGDWKLGWLPVEPAEVNWQTRSYTVIVARCYQKTRGFHSIIRVRASGSVYFDSAEMDELDLLAHEEAMLELLERRHDVRDLARAGRWSELPPLVEGKHCRYCPALPFCPAKVAGVRELARVDAADPNPKELTPELVASAWRRLKHAEKTLGRYKAIIEDFARQQPVSLEGSEILGEKETSRESIVPSRARTALERFHGPLGGAIVGAATKKEETMSKSAFRAALKSLFLPTLPEEDRKITHIEKGMLQMLRENGAISVSTSVSVCEHVPRKLIPAEVVAELESGAAP